MQFECNECNSQWNPPRGEIVACPNCGNTQDLVMVPPMCEQRNLAIVMCKPDFLYNSDELKIVFMLAQQNSELLNDGLVVASHIYIKGGKSYSETELKAKCLELAMQHSEVKEFFKPTLQ